MQSLILIKYTSCHSQCISSHGPLAVSSGFALKKNPAHMHSPGSVNAKQTKKRGIHAHAQDRARGLEETEGSLPMLMPWQCAFMNLKGGAYEGALKAGVHLFKFQQSFCGILDFPLVKHKAVI